MSFYPPEINKKFHTAQNIGTAQKANGVGTGATFVCGAVLRFTLRVDEKTKEILEAKFKTNGCGFVIAAAQTLTEKIIGKSLTELHGLDAQTLQTEIEDELGFFGEHRKHCLLLSVETLHSAFADFRGAKIEEWTGEKALICTCFGISEETIEQLVKSKTLETIEEVTADCSAGGGCGACQPLIQEIIDVARLEEI